MYAKMNREELRFSRTQKDSTWLPVVDGKVPIHDTDTQVAGVSGYDVQDKQVVRLYRLERRPQRAVMFDQLADRMAKRLHHSYAALSK